MSLAAREPHLGNAKNGVRLVPSDGYLSQGGTMRPDDEPTLADRMSSIEVAISELTRRFDKYFQDAGAREPVMRADKREPRQAHFGFKEEAPSAAPPPAPPQEPHSQPWARPAGAAKSASPPVSPTPRVDPVFVLQSKGAEWWLARGGGLLTLFALVLLYQYGVDRNWITPILRIAVGTGLGVALMAMGNRMARAPESASDAVVGLREVMMGAALAAWFITGYAAAVMYELISLSSARIIFLLLSIMGAWLALREKRALIGFLSVGVGFATPILLPSPVPSIPAFAFYLGALTVVGLIIYLMRGWQLVLWLTFGAFWFNSGSAAWIACCRSPGSGESARIAMTVLIVLAGIAMVRAPVLRRRLLALGSHLYTETKRSDAGTSILTELAKKLSGLTGHPGALDSPAVWAITLASPLIALAQLSIVWPRVSSVIGGVIGLAIAGLAYRLASSPRAPDEEFTHVEAAATAIWSLAGVLCLANGIANQLSISTPATYIIAASLHSFVALSMRDSRFVIPVRIARATTLVIVLSVLLAESNVLHGLNLYWTFAGACGIAVCAWSAWLHRASGSKTYAVVMAVASYVALMVVDARFLGAILRPLVTASYALMGTALLIASRNAANSAGLRRLGGITLVIVVVRLLAIDLADVETIWRVLLFLGCGALFLFASHRMQRSGKLEPESAPGPAA